MNTLTTLARSALLQERVLLVVSRQIQALFAAKPDIKMDDLDLSRSKESLNALFQTLVDRGQNDLQAADTFLTPEQLSAATIQSN